MPMSNVFPLDFSGHPPIDERLAGLRNLPAQHDSSVPPGSKLVFEKDKGTFSGVPLSPRPSASFPMAFWDMFPALFKGFLYKESHPSPQWNPNGMTMLSCLAKEHLQTSPFVSSKNSSSSPAWAPRDIPWLNAWDTLLRFACYRWTPKKSTWLRKSEERALAGPKQKPVRGSLRRTSSLKRQRAARFGKERRTSAK